MFDSIEFNIVSFLGTEEREGGGRECECVCWGERDNWGGTITVIGSTINILQEKPLFVTKIFTGEPKITAN